MPGMSRYVAALDQGTTSTRCILFDRGGRIVGRDQREHRQLYRRPGWVEHDAEEIWRHAELTIRGALAAAGATAADVAALGIANQRETTVVWERASGRPIHNAIVWQDTRTDALCREIAGAPGPDRLRARTGLPIATYFAGPKLRWLLDEVDGARERAAAGELLFGTIDSWLLYRLSGGALHLTDVSNASRTLLMDLRTLDWDDALLDAVGVPRAPLPRIVASSERYGEAATTALAGVPLAGMLGDQQAATFGQTCFAPGEAKNTYGTGNFLLLNTGREPVASAHGLLTTVGYRLADADPVYCLEGSIAVTGALVQWLRDNLGLIAGSSEVEALARTVADNGGCYVVPAFSGLYAPYWRADARGVIAGLTSFVTSGHIARAVLEATAFQSREVVDAMREDAGIALGELKVDGGMVVNETLMQFQADVLGVPVVRPVVAETTALGAAYAAGLAVGFWPGLDDLREHWAEQRRWTPRIGERERAELLRQWRKAVTRSLGWVD